MKQKHIYSLLDQTFTTVRVTFDRLTTREIAVERKLVKPNWTNDDGNGNERCYIYKVPREWDVQVEDQLVVLGAEAGLCIVTVIRVDAEPDIDVDANYTYKWAVGRVDLTEYNERVRKEKDFLDQMMHIERVKQRESLVNSFRDSLPEGSEARNLFELTTASLAGPLTPPSDFPMGPAQAGFTGGNS